MDHPYFEGAAAAGFKGAAAGAGASGSAASRPSAIERQMAVTAGLGHEKIHRANRGDNDRLKTRPFGLPSFLILFLFVAATLAILFADSGQLTDVRHFVQRGVNAIQQIAGSAIYDKETAYNNYSVLTTQSAAAASHSSIDSASEGTPAAQKKSTEISAPAAVSIPIADVSLRSRPELLEQLVRIYRAKLAGNPNDAAARAALNQLQERSLTELQTIILEESDSVMLKSLAIVSRLFPEAADNVRYKYLVARVDRIHSQEQSALATTQQGVEPAPTAAAAEPASAFLPKPAAALPKLASSEKTVPVETGSASSSASAHKKAVEDVPSSKPEIRAVSITPGAMIHDRFVPDVEGNAVLVEVSYRNFDKVVEEGGVNGQAGVSLVARLGVPGYSNVLAEAPIEILGDRGAKSVVMTTLMPADADEYKLNFILNGEFLASRTVRPSRQLVGKDIQARQSY